MATTMYNFHIADKVCTTETEAFFPEYDPEDPVAVEEARAEALITAEKFCKTCPFTRPCLKHAMDTGTEHGVWAGLWLEDPGTLNWAKRKNRQAVKKGQVT